MTPSYPHYAAHIAPVLERLPDLPSDVEIVAGYPDVVRAERAGKRIVLMQHGIGQSYSDHNAHYPGGEGNDAVGLFLAPNFHSAARWKEAYPDKPVEVVGCPLLDNLPKRKRGPKPVIAFAFHWNGFRLNEMRTAFGWYRQAVSQVAAEYNVIGHGHPRARGLPRFYAKHGIEYVPDFEDVCKRADLMVFDNTSAGYLFAATGRPVVVLNAPIYRTDVHHGLRFWEAANVGVNVWTPDELLPAIATAIKDPVAQKSDREEAVSLVFAHRGDAAGRAARAVREWTQ